MIESTYDFCLLYRHRFFEIVGFQTDDTFMLTNEEFATDEKNAIAKTKFLTKSRNCLTTIEAIKFNGLKIELHFNSEIILRQKTHVEKISFIKRFCISSISIRDVVRENLIIKNQYIAQKTKGAYLTSFCQFETSFVRVGYGAMGSLHTRNTWRCGAI